MLCVKREGKPKKYITSVTLSAMESVDATAAKEFDVVCASSSGESWVGLTASQQASDRLLLDLCFVTASEPVPQGYEVTDATFASSSGESLTVCMLWQGTSMVGQGQPQGDSDYTRPAPQMPRPTAVTRCLANGNLTTLRLRYETLLPDNAIKPPSTHLQPLTLSLFVLSCVGTLDSCCLIRRSKASGWRGAIYPPP